MKQVLVLAAVCVLLALAGCAEAPWGQPNPTETNTPTPTEDQLSVNNTSMNMIISLVRNQMTQILKHSQ